MRKIDEAAMRWTQDAYLWLLDRTGVYASTVFMVIFLMGYATFFWHHGWRPDYVGLAIIGVTGVAQGVLYLQQDKKQYEAFNARSRHWRTTEWRTGLLFVCVFFMVVDVMTSKPLMAISFLCDIVCYGYVMCVQIRDREPPPKREPQLATVRGVS